MTDIQGQIEVCDGVEVFITPPLLEGLRSICEKLPPTVPLAAVIEADENGLIISFKPASGMRWEDIFFLQNLMIGQRLQLIDQTLKINGVIK